MLMKFADGYHCTSGCCLFSLTKHCHTVSVRFVRGSRKWDKSLGTLLFLRLPVMQHTLMPTMEDNSICPQEKDNSSNYFTFAKYMRHLLVTWKLTQ